MAVMTKRKLRPVDARVPQAGRREGRIEVVVRTPIMGFRDDVVIRIRPDPDGARVDIRSTSRYGRHDFGTNAARIASLSEAIDDAVGRSHAGEAARAGQEGQEDRPEGGQEAASR